MRFYNGHGLMAALGMNLLVHMLPREDISKFYNGHEQMDAIGMNSPVSVLLVVGILRFFNGQFQMVVHTTSMNYAR